MPKPIILHFTDDAHVIEFLYRFVCSSGYRESHGIRYAEFDILSPYPPQPVASESQPEPAADSDPNDYRAQCADPFDYDLGYAAGYPNGVSGKSYPLKFDETCSDSYVAGYRVGYRIGANDQHVAPPRSNRREPS